VYPNDPAMNLPDQPSFLRSEVSVLADTLNAHGHPTAGGQYWGAVSHYADQSGPGGFTFTQLEAQGVQMIPIVGRRLLLGLRGWTVHSMLGDNNQTPFYLLPATGGSNTIRAFDSFTFHDLNSITTTAELRLALWMHVDLAGFVDAGNVAARYSDLNLDQTAVGAGVRLHTARATIGRLDMAHGSQGWTVMLRTGDPFKLSRVTRRLATVPFAP
jgi:outer membrane protein assembly factor BamA